MSTRSFKEAISHIVDYLDFIDEKRLGGLDIYSGMVFQTKFIYGKTLQEMYDALDFEMDKRVKAIQSNEFNVMKECGSDVCPKDANGSER